MHATTARRGVVITTRCATAAVTDRRNGPKSTAYTAAHGEPQAPAAGTVDGDGPGAEAHSQFDEPVAVGAPPAAQIADMDKLDP